MLGKYILIGLPFLFYFIYTIRYSFVLSRNIFLTRGQKVLNFILIWIIAFIWILFLKIFFQSTPGSHQIKNKNYQDGFTESGLGILDDPNDHH